MNKKSDLKMWTDGEDYVIAESLDEVEKILFKLGYITDFDEVEKKEYIEAFEIMNAELDFTFNDEKAGKITKTVSEWIKEMGKGFFASVNY